VAVLIVDDNLADVGLMRMAWQQAAIKEPLVAARTHDEALEQVARKPRLILLDLNLSGTHGFELLEELRSQTATRLIPIIILTTSAAQSEVDRAYELGANAFLTKPPDLVQTIAFMAAVAEFWLGLAEVPCV
jgi:two-component system, chemotaxis family, response regulator Rcp1